MYTSIHLETKVKSQEITRCQLRLIGFARELYTYTAF